MKKMKNSENINIVIGASREYALFSMVMFESLFENNKDEIFSIYLYYDAPMMEVLIKLKQMVENAGSKFIPIYVPEERSQNLVINKKVWWHKSVWYRYFCIEDLADKVDRVMIIGTDTIIQSNIRELYDIDMQDKCIAAVTDMGMQYVSSIEEECKKYNLKKEAYVNADMLIVDIHKAKDIIKVGNMMHLYLNNNLWALDQDVLNFFFHDHIFVIEDMRYNFIPTVASKILEEDEYKEELEKAVIIHYAAKKPWNEYDANCAHDLWFAYAKRLPYYEEILESAIRLSGKSFSDYKKKSEKLEYELRKHIFKMDKLFWMQDLLWDACDNDIVINKLDLWGIKNIAIYGYGKLGEHLLRYCNDKGVQVSHIVDSSKEGNVSGIPIIKPSDIDKCKNVDAVIVTPIQDFDEIKKQIDINEYRVISLEEIV